MAYTEKLTLIKLVCTTCINAKATPTYVSTKAATEKL